MDIATTIRSLPRKLKLGMILTGLMLVILLIINQPLQTGSAPQGIVSYQLAATADHSMAILRSWRGDAMVWAHLSLWLDFLFVPVYVLTLIMVTNQLMRDRPGVRERNVARWVRALFVAAGISDIVENILLLSNLNPPTDSLSLSATICALIKFTGLMLGLAGLVIIRAARRHPLAHG
ncbi:hypothetical protein DYI22_16355 [Marinobacter lipolyticus]|uniref:hypothetical protein n=1 Tax=Marinobacter lipolyticus TaxID=209639 RepID=UPI001BCE3DD2|nr:hypothetical protein [Marinobacter lipolyticus]MBS8242060.1 hypothetical protein [Marinobacter lipolyticus]